MRAPFVVGLLGASLSAVAQDCPPAAPVFTEVAVESGIDFMHDGPISYPEIFFMSGGGVAGDFNSDGWPDLFVLGAGSRPDALYINNADGTFADSAVAAGLARSHMGVGASAADFDGDGDLDIHVTSHSSDASSGGQVPGPGHHRLYRNNGDGTFTDVAAQAGVSTTAFSEPDGWSSSWGDYDLDGNLDLAVAGWFINKQGRNRLFRNNGDGTFSDATAAAGLSSLEETFGFSPRFCDMDGDRYPELIWTADFGTSRYFVNNTDGTFTDMTESAGVSYETNGMGVTVADFNRDGLMDWYATSIDKSQTGSDREVGEGNMLYINQGNHTYQELSRESGVSEGWWGWGAEAIDFNHDTHLDLAETNGWHYSPWTGNPSCLWVNNGDGTFAEIAASSGFVHTAEGRGLVTFDYDRDGDRDMVIFTRQGRVFLFRNDTPASECGRWMAIAIDTANAPGLAPHGVGARIQITAGGVTQYREIHAGTNYISQSVLEAHVGLGEAEVVDEIRVRWPDGRESIRSQIPVNTRLTIHAPSACPADQNADGEVTPTDFGAWLANFNGADPLADTNDDGEITPTDFGAWLSAFNAGCG